MALPVIRNTYPRAHKAARPPSSRLRRAEQRLSQDRVPCVRRNEDRIARADRLKLAHCPRSLAATLAALPSMSLNPFAPLYLARSRSARPLPRGVAGHVAHPVRSILAPTLVTLPCTIGFFSKSSVAQRRCYSENAGARPAPTRLRPAFAGLRRGKQLFSSCIISRL